MGIVNDNIDDLMGLAKSVALKTLGGPAGQDQAAWAEDIAQDVMVMLVEKEAEGTLREDELFGLCDVSAFRAAANFKTGEARRREIESEHGSAINRNLTGQSAESMAADPLDILMAMDMEARFANLSPLLASTLELVCEDGMSIPDTAKRMGISPNTVYQRLWQIKEIVTDKDHKDYIHTGRPTMEAMEQEVRDNFHKHDKAVRMKHERINNMRNNNE